MAEKHADLKKQARAVWGRGDYRPMARLLEPASRNVVAACGIAAGELVLDVAAGDGNCAAAAARTGARVVASDFSPLLVTFGRERTRAEGLDVLWELADAENLPHRRARSTA